MSEDVPAGISSRRIKTTRTQREIIFIEQTRPECNCNIWFYKIIHGALDPEVLANVINYFNLHIPLL